MEMLRTIDNFISVLNFKDLQVAILLKVLLGVCVCVDCRLLVVECATHKHALHT